MFLLYVNDLQRKSQRSTTLFADDTLLSLSDSNLSRLENRVNTQLQYIAQWLNQTKLTLNYFKATYLLFNKQLHVPISSNFSFHVNQKEISRSESVKYFCGWFDDKLNLSAYTQKLSLQLVRCCNILYHIRDFVNARALVVFYYSFGYSSLTYGIIAWGTAAQNQLREIKVKLNNITLTMTWNKKCSYVSQLYKKLGFLKLHDVCKLELAKFLHKLFKNKLPNLCNYNFTTIDKIHDYATRKPSRSYHFLPRVSKSAGQNKIEFRGAKLWKEIR